MALTSKDIDRIANLARLELSSEESERMLSQLNGFFGIVEKAGVLERLIRPVIAHHYLAKLADLRMNAELHVQTSLGCDRSAPARALRHLIQT